MAKKNNTNYMIAMTGTRLVKVGYTNNIRRRMKEYAAHNPLVVLVDIINGTEKTEKDFHGRMEDMGFVPAKVHWTLTLVGFVKKTEWYIMPEGMDKKDLLAKGFKIFAE